jgi:ATP-binding cassette subfamily C protein
LLNSFNSFLTETVLFLVVAVGFFFIDPVVTVAAIFYFGLIAFVIQYFIGSLMGRAEEEKYTSSLRSATAVSDLLSVFRELVVMGRRDKYIDEIFKARSSVAKTTAITFYLSGMPRYIIEAALLVGVALFVLSQAVSGDIASTAGKVGIFLAGGFRLTAALLPLQSSLLVLKSAIPAAKLAHDILESAHETVKATDHPDVGNPEQTEDQLPIGVVFENVTFYYPDSKTPTLVDLNFTIEPGSQTALMGPSGAGKSTIADLLCFLLSPTSGRVFRISNSLEKEWESVGRVSYVPQKPGMVSGTILENVALGVDPQSVNRLDVIAALEEAHLGTLISELPKGIDTPLGKLKDSLSGGQMQRLGLARAIYFKPSLLVMDEATSALDAESESEIQKTLEELRGKVTVVVIAHRLNTIQHADKVILVEDGKVLDSGKFKELIARNPSVERGVELMRIDESDTP